MKRAIGPFRILVVVNGDCNWTEEDPHLSVVEGHVLVRHMGVRDIFDAHRMAGATFHAIWFADDVDSEARRYLENCLRCSMIDDGEAA